MSDIYRDARHGDRKLARARMGRVGFADGGTTLDFSGNGGPHEMGTPPPPSPPKPQEGAIMRGLRNIIESQPGGMYYKTPAAPPPQQSAKKGSKP